MIKTAILTISDRCSEGKQEDLSGPAIEEILKENNFEVCTKRIVPDEVDRISADLIYFSDEAEVDVVFTTGGTGLGPRDVTPEATLAVIDRSVPGIVEVIRSYGKDRTPFAMLSRGEAGVRGDSVIVNLPGSSKGALESLQALFPGLLHIFPMIQGKSHNESDHKAIREV